MVFRQNVKSPEQLKKLLADFQAASGTGLLTAVDEEGGSVARLANASGFDLPQYQSAQAVGTTGTQPMPVPWGRSSEATSKPTA